MPDFLHNDPEFKELLSIVSFEKGIDISLVEKDYKLSKIIKNILIKFD